MVRRVCCAGNCAWAVVGGAGRCRLSVGFGRLVGMVEGLVVIMLGMSRQQVVVGSFFLSMGVLCAIIHV